MARCTLAVLLCLCAPCLAETYLVAAGIETYDDASISALQYAAKDASALAKVYRDAGAGPVYELLSSSPAGERPTRSRLLAAFEEIRLKATERDTVLFFFAGHGIERDGVQYLLPYDTRLSLVEDTALPMRLLNRSLQGCRAGQVLFIIDACRNDPQAGKGDVDSELSDGLARGLRPKVAAPEGGRMPATALLLACDVGQRAWEWPGENHGAFTYFLLQALMGKVADAGGQITLKALAEYIAKELPDWCRRAQKPEQTPRLDLGDGGDFVLLKLPARLPGPEDVRPVENTPPKLTVQVPGGVWHGKRLYAPDGGPIRLTGTVEDDQPGVTVRFLNDDLTLTPLGGNRFAFEISLPPQLLADLSGTLVTATDAQGWKDGAALHLLARPKNWPAYLNSFEPPDGMDWSYFKVSPRDGMPQVFIPGGEFELGANPGESAAEKDNKPRRTIHVSDFWIDMHEVTVAQYRKFYEDTKDVYIGDQMDPGDQAAWSTSGMHPIAAVTNHQASAYAGDMARELPTEAQWEKAARAGLKGMRFPWGNTLDPTRAVLGRDGQGALPVCSTQPSPIGLYDMIGNVAEMCSDLFAVDAYEQLDRWDPVNQMGTINGGLVVRGGAFDTDDWTVAQRDRQDDNGFWNKIGFRCVDAEPYGEVYPHGDLTILQSLAIQLQDAVAENYRKTGKYAANFDEVLKLGKRTQANVAKGVWSYDPSNGAVRLLE